MTIERTRSEIEVLLRKHIREGERANEKATEQTKKIAALNAKLIFVNGAGQLPKRGKSVLGDDVMKEVEGLLDG